MALGIAQNVSSFLLTFYINTFNFAFTSNETLSLKL